MSMFDPDTLLNQEFDGANSTKREPIPVGEYTAIVEKIDLRPWQTKDGSKSGLALDLIWELDSEDLRKNLDREKVTAKQGIMLDLTDEGGLDMGKGKNIGLGRLREAVSLNDPSVPFSFQQLVGQMAIVKVTHRVDGEDVYDEIRQVAKPA